MIFKNKNDYENRHRQSDVIEIHENKVQILYLKEKLDLLLDYLNLEVVEIPQRTTIRKKETQA